VKPRFLSALGAIYLAALAGSVLGAADGPPAIIFYAQPSRVFLQGQVREGGFVIPPGPLFTAGQVIQSVGGLKDSADARDIEIRRRFTDGGMVCLRVDLVDAGPRWHDPLLVDGDIIFVPNKTKAIASPSR
jgi:protein involved in polysaccharide export with SLBB domain